MAVTSEAERSTLAVRIQNGQTASGEWRYKYVNIVGINPDLDISNSTVKAELGNIYGAISGVLVGTPDGLRVVRTDIVSVTE